MLQHVLTPDINNEGYLRTNAGNIGEILLGTHSHIDAARFGGLAERRNDGLESGLIGKKILGLKDSAIFRRVFDEFPKRIVRNLIGQRVGRTEAGRGY